MNTVWIGYDQREADAYAVALSSLVSQGWRGPTYAVALAPLVHRGLYQRPTFRKGDQLFDVISDAPMSTEFALSRFLVPHLCRMVDDEQADGWALFMDCDVLVRAPIDDLFALADPTKAVQVVKHPPDLFASVGKAIKMDGQEQQVYHRKCWSSVMLFNLGHPALRALTVEKVNTWNGRGLHGFRWLEDCFLGDLPPEWNHLVGLNDPNPDAKVAHFTLGVPSLPGYGDCEHALEWQRTLALLGARQCANA